MSVRNRNSVAQNLLCYTGVTTIDEISDCVYRAIRYLSGSIDRNAGDGADHMSAFEKIIPLAEAGCLV